MGQVFSVKIFLDLEGVLNKARIHTLIIELHDPILMWCWLYDNAPQHTNLKDLCLHRRKYSRVWLEVTSNSVRTLLLPKCLRWCRIRSDLWNSARQLKSRTRCWSDVPQILNFELKAQLIGSSHGRVSTNAPHVPRILKFQLKAQISGERSWEQPTNTSRQRSRYTGSKYYK